MQHLCRKCKWYDKQDDEYGLCKLNPPSPVSVVHTNEEGSVTTTIDYVLPIVPKDWGCGKFDAH